MKKSELINAVTDDICGTRGGVSKADVAAMLESLGDVMAAELFGGGDVPLPGVGRIVTKQRAARTGRNPRTGKPVTIPATRVVLLRVRKELKDALKG